MSPDYELADEVLVSEPAQLKVIADPLRSQILDLALERAVSVTELAAALDRPKSSLAYHVDALVDAGLLAVVRTRRVRAIDERFYGRTGRTFIISPGAKATKAGTFLAAAASEIDPDLGEEYMETMRHVRLPREDAEEFFERVVALAEELTRRPRRGDTMYGFVAAVYPTDLPVLPDPDEVAR